MRLCFIANPESIHTRRWVRYFAERGHEVHLIGEHATRYNPPPGVTFHDLTRQVDIRKVRYVAWALGARRLVREIGPALLHAHQVTSAGWLGAAAGWHPFVVTAWGSDLLLATRRSRVQWALARRVLRRADYVTCVSGELARCAQALGAPPERVEVAAWGVDLDCFHPTPADESLRARLGLGEEPVVISLRPVRAVYRPLDVAEAIPLVLKCVPEARFVVRTYAPDPGLLARFQRVVQESGSAEAVRYVGELPDDRAIADLYRLSTVALSVPFSDAVPQSVLEAMACGVVPVVSDLPSVREWVGHEKEGLVVPVGDVAAIADAVVRLLTESTLHARLRVASLSLVHNRADARVGMRRHEEIYRLLVEARRASTSGTLGP